jgi:hypothetical protein
MNIKNCVFWDVAQSVEGLVTNWTEKYVRVLVPDNFRKFISLYGPNWPSGRLSLSSNGMPAAFSVE